MTANFKGPGSEGEGVGGFADSLVGSSSPCRHLLLLLLFLPNKNPIVFLVSLGLFPPQPWKGCLGKEKRVELSDVAPCVEWSQLYHVSVDLGDV